MVKTFSRPTICCKSRKQQNFKEIPFSEITFWKKKTLTSLVDYSTLLSLTRITFQNKGKYLTQYKYSTLQLEYFFLPNFTKDSGLHAHFLASWEACCR